MVTKKKGKYHPKFVNAFRPLLTPNTPTLKNVNSYLARGKAVGLMLRACVLVMFDRGDMSKNMQF